MEVITLLVSLAALVFALFTFYWVQWRAPRISVLPGILMRAGSTGSTGFQFYLPITFVNHSHKPGVIYNLELHVRHLDSPKEFRMMASRFSELKDSNKIVDVEIHNAFSVFGRTANTRMVRFVWWDASTPNFHLAAGTYAMKLRTWISRSGKHIESEMHFSIDEDQIDVLLRAMARSEASVIEFATSDLSPTNHCKDISAK
ncbi:MAG: hypothetical protein AAF711_14680 [Planctomycetota bacterium]